MTVIAAQSFLVEIGQLAHCRLVPWSVDDETLSPGHVLLRVERFGFSANNVTYAVLGDAMDYWRFFPAPDGLGCVPVWGFAIVEASRCQGVAVGERFYGYYPMSTHLVVQPGKVAKYGFIDASAHRSELSLIYNQYLRCTEDPLYSLANENMQMLLRPLFTTSFLLDDFFNDNDFFGARNLVLTSASSKTAIGMAHLLHHMRNQRGRHYEVLGVTSSRNQDFVRSLGIYDQVLCYEQLSELNAEVPSAIVDFAGNGQTLSQLHHHLGQALCYSSLVGVSHWNQRDGRPKDPPGPKPALFFAPAQARKRTQEWGSGEFQHRLAEHWQNFAVSVAQWMHVEYAHGAGAVERVYQLMLAGQSDAQQGHILSLTDNEQHPT